LGVFKGVWRWGWNATERKSSQPQVDFTTIINKTIQKHIFNLNFESGREQSTSWLWLLFTDQLIFQIIWLYEWLGKSEAIASCFCSVEVGNKKRVIKEGCQKIQQNKTLLQYIRPY